MKATTDNYTADHARALGDYGIATSVNNAVKKGFSVAAASLVILEHLRKYGRTPGEDLVLVAKSAGHVPHDDRAFGSVFSSLSRKKEIYCVDYCNRRRGHGTAGGRIWRICE